MQRVKLILNIKTVPYLDKISQNLTVKWCLSFREDKSILTLVLLNPELPFFENTIAPVLLASDEAISSESTQFLTLIENTSLQQECCRLKG